LFHRLVFWPRKRSTGYPARYDNIFYYGFLGSRVKKDDVLGVVDSPFGDNEEEVLAPSAGLVIGKTSLPLINEGDALFHIAKFQAVHEVADNVEAFTETLTDMVPDDQLLEPPII